MDNNFLYLMLLALVVGGVLLGVGYLIKKSKLNKQTLSLSEKAIIALWEIFDQFDFKSEDEVEKYKDLIIEAINIVLVTDFENKDIVIENIYMYTINKAYDIGIEITDERKALIKKLIRFTINKIEE